LALPDTVFVESLGNRVGGIARPEGSPAIFVRGALPGELVRISPVNVKKTYIEADLVSITEPSIHRTEPFCAYWGICGGCSLQHLQYSEQLRWKRIWVEKAVRNLPAPEVDPAVPSPFITGYRNKATFDIIQSRVTLHAFRGDHVPVENCPLMNRSSAEALEIFLAGGVPEGLTEVCVRGGTNTDNTLLELTGNIQTAIPSCWPPAVIKCSDKWESLQTGEMFEKLGNFVFPVPPGGFFQVNTKAAEKLVDLVLSHIPSTDDSVLDLYGGVGTFGIPLASRGMDVTSVEMNREASMGCRRAAEMNCIPRGKLNSVNTTDTLFLSSSVNRRKSFSTVVTDPPRAGMGIGNSRQLCQLKPDRIVYVSCDPFTAARDIAILIQGGYAILEITPVDMFPHTDHIETVFLLKRG
jgi:23S rRNA (uracil1939-C5)-methyltransferase